ncbi:unnamed protein product [Clavelina lepadiformis]|uniref:CCHC-type domain-containing protein n=1 Tax=Clavelina lepadiformis TaxID=159417 RepID=A0ABP0G8I2_CLALP
MAGKRVFDKRLCPNYGKVKTCHYCDETGHLVKECPYKVTKQDVVNESWKAVGETRRTFAGVTFKQMENTSPERYSPSKEDFPELQNNSGALNNRLSTPLAKTKPPKLGTSKGQINHFDGSTIEFSGEEDSLGPRRHFQRRPWDRQMPI